MYMECEIVDLPATMYETGEEKATVLLYRTGLGDR